MKVNFVLKVYPHDRAVLSNTSEQLAYQLTFRLFSQVHQKTTCAGGGSNSRNTCGYSVVWRCCHIHKGFLWSQGCHGCQYYFRQSSKWSVPPPAKDPWARRGILYLIEVYWQHTRLWKVKLDVFVWTTKQVCLSPSTSKELACVREHCSITRHKTL